MSQNAQKSFAVVNIDSKRIVINESHVGQRISFEVQSSNPTELDAFVDESTGEAISKKLFNTNAASSVALSSGYNKQLNKSAKELEAIIAKELAAGKGEGREMTDAQRAWLNTTSFGFSLLSNHPLYNTIQKGDDITGKVMLVEGVRIEKQGNKEVEVPWKILTLDPKTITVKAAMVLAPTTSRFATAMPDAAANAAADAKDALAPKAPRQRKAATA